jgi:hypothetical protein
MSHLMKNHSYKNWKRPNGNFLDGVFQIPSRGEMLL